MDNHPAEPEETPDRSPELPREHDDVLEGLDADSAAAEHREPSSALPPKLEAWRRRSATGAILTGLALGFQQALEAPREQPTVTIETSGTPPRDLPVDADVGVLGPRHSVVSIRPWLLDSADKTRNAEDPDEASAPPVAGVDRKDEQ